MIKVDEQALQRDIARFDKFVRFKAESINKSVASVFKVELKRLVQTLINFTPQSAKEKIQRDVNSKFVALGNQDGGGFQNQSWHKSGLDSDIKWVLFTPSVVFGIAPDLDARKASVDDLVKIHQRATAHGKQRLGGRGKQTFYLLQKVITNKAGQSRLISKLVSHIGRLKAGWLPSADKLGGVAGVSQKVSRHANGARGYAVDGLNNDKFPTFTLENHAAGVGRAEVVREVRNAMRVRSEAMPKRIAQILQHPELARQEVQE